MLYIYYILYYLFNIYNYDLYKKKKKNKNEYDEKSDNNNKDNNGMAILKSMGFEENVIKLTLKICNNNVDNAASILFQSVDALSQQQAINHHVM